MVAVLVPQTPAPSFAEHQTIILPFRLFVIHRPELSTVGAEVGLLTSADSAFPVGKVALWVPNHLRCMAILVVALATGGGAALQNHSSGVVVPRRHTVQAREVTLSGVPHYSLVEILGPFRIGLDVKVVFQSSHPLPAFVVQVQHVLNVE